MRDDVRRSTLPDESLRALKHAILKDPTLRWRLTEEARRAGVSEPLFHQRFEAATGEKFGAFVRRARLQRACALMRAFPHWSLTRISFEAGFSESSDFSRSFRRAFGLPPRGWDRTAPLNILSAMALEGHPPGKTSDIARGAGFAMVPAPRSSVFEVEPDPPLTLLTLQVDRALMIEGQHAAWARLEAVASELGFPFQPVGLSYDSPLDTPPQHWRFALGLAVSDPVRIPEDFERLHCSAGSAVRVPVSGGAVNFVEVYDDIVRGFVPNSRWCPRPAPLRFHFTSDPRRHEMFHWEFDLVVPLHDAGDEDTA